MPRALALLLSLAVLLGLAATIEAAPLQRPSARAPALARSCIVETPDLPPLFPAPEATGQDSGENGDDDDEEDDEDDDEDTTPGLILPGSSTCIALSGTVTAGLQYDRFRIPATVPDRPPSGFTWQPSSSFRIATSHDLTSGLRIGSAFEFSIWPTAGEPDTVTVDEAVVLVGPYTFGLSDSRFNFWTGDEFAFSTRLPGRTAGLLSWERDLTETWSLALSLEDPTLTGGTSFPISMGRVPDGVARLVYSSGPWTVHLAGVLRDIPGSSPRLGRAGIVGVTYEATILGRPGNVTAQIVSGVDAAPYIGSQLDATAASRILLADDPNRGFSGVVAAQREWTKELASNVYVSHYQITVPLLDRSKGKLRIDRLAANLVWTPVKGLRAGIETSYADSRVAITSRVVPAALAGRSLSAQLFIERTF